VRQFVEKEGYKEIHFFGDKTSKGGNDYEIFEGFFPPSLAPPRGGQYKGMCTQPCRL
jgi:hypothetical protein